LALKYPEKWLTVFRWENGGQKSVSYRCPENFCAKTFKVWQTSKVFTGETTFLDNYIELKGFFWKFLR
jgi:hypothetical protein